MFTVEMTTYYPNDLWERGPDFGYRIFATEEEARPIFNSFIERFKAEFGEPDSVDKYDAWWAIDNANNSDEHCLVGIQMYENNYANLDEEFEYLVQFAKRHKRQVGEFKLILSDVGDAFFPNPHEVEERYANIHEAKDRINEINTTHLKCTYTPLWLIHPDGTKENVYPKE